VAQIVLRQAQHLGAITAVGEVLVFTTLRFAEEIVKPSTLGLPQKTPLRQNELDLAAKLVDGITGDWKPEQYKDRYSENLLEIIKAKTKKGSKPRLGELAPKPAGGDITDLMEKLRASLAGHGAGAAPAKSGPGERRAASGRTAGARKTTPARRHRRAA
jgi:DNA end-binding protein Ku